jgi:hypothetical protein
VSPISINEYLDRITKYVIVEKSVLIMLVIFIDRTCTVLPDFIISSLTIHRFLIAAVTVCCKSVSDKYSTNTFFAKVGGIGVEELNILELELCKIVDWKLSISNSAVEMYYLNLVISSSRYGLTEKVNARNINGINTYLD